MEAIQANVEFVEVRPEAVSAPETEALMQLSDIELALVGGGTGEVILG